MFFSIALKKELEFTCLPSMTEQYPCGVCKLEVNDNDDAVQCDLCDRWNHINCVEINKQKFEKLRKDPVPWYCPACMSEIPFSQMNNKEFKNLLYPTNTLQQPLQNIKKSNKEIKDLMARFKQVNDLDPSENLTSCYYYDVNDISKLRINENDLSVIHLNISSLPLHINELKLFLSFFKVKFDIISISESRITKSNTLTTNIDIPGYNIEHTPTESKAGGCLLYISNKIPYKLQNDLNVYCPKQLESLLIEVLLSNKPSQIIGTIYKHPSFTNDHLINMLNAIHHENKSTLLTGDFNVNLINYNKRGTYNFLELLCNYNFTPQITLPTRVTEKSATLIDNIFVNNPSFKYLSGNITTSISDHLPQFIILENFKGSNLKREQISTTYRDF